MNYIESVTAKKIGWGSARWRRVTSLTKSEREAVKNGDTVYFCVGKRAWNQSGYKIVTYRIGYGYDSREPNAIELENITKMEGINRRI